ncbi:MAG: hypothetical protein KDA42_02835 [Planctomycetales bacterium]|nr:hypothetical protein [Planctomycetales bacterium]
MSHQHGAPDDQPGGLSQGLRTAISFLLFVHLFALGVAVLSNFGPVSPLRRQLNVPFVQPYLNLLHMNVAYNFQLVDGSEYDAPLSLEIDLSGDGKQDETVSFPADASPNVRSGRYYQLMLNAALMQGEDDYEADLPHTIARRLLLEHGIDAGKHRLRLRRHSLTSREAWDADGTAPDLSAADRFQTIYEADVSFHRDRLVLVKQEAAAQSAIVRPEAP